MKIDAEECFLRASADIVVEDKMGRKVLHSAFLKLSDGALGFTKYVEEKSNGQYNHVYWIQKAHKMLHASTIVELDNVVEDTVKEIPFVKKLDNLLLWRI